MFNRVFYRHAFVLLRHIWFPTRKRATDDRTTLSFGVLHRMRFSALIVTCILLRPILTFLWAIDDLVWPGYKNVAVHQPVFIVAGARTGSTRLHEVMEHAGGSKFVSFTLAQLLNPYLIGGSGQWIVSVLEKFDKRILRGIGQRAIRATEQERIPHDLQMKHDIRLTNTEEDDWWFVHWHLTSVFVTHLVPFTVTASLQFNHLTGKEQDRNLFGPTLAGSEQWWEQRRCNSTRNVFKNCCIGQGEMVATPPSVCAARQSCCVCCAARFLSKSHGIQCVPAIKRCFPDAHFVVAVRDPRESIASFYSLRDSALRMFCGVSPYEHKELLEFQMAWDKQYYAEELRQIRSTIGTEHKLAGREVKEPSPPREAVVVGAGRPRNRALLQIVGILLIPILLVVVALLGGWACFMLFICRLTRRATPKLSGLGGKPPPPTALSPTALPLDALAAAAAPDEQPTAVVPTPPRKPRRAAGSGLRGTWSVVRYDDLIGTTLCIRCVDESGGAGSMEEVIAGVFTQVGAVLDSEGLRRLQHKAAEQAKYASPHTTSTLLASLGYSDERYSLGSLLRRSQRRAVCSLVTDFKDYLDFFFPRSRA